MNNKPPPLPHSPWMHTQPRFPRLAKATPCLQVWPSWCYGASRSYGVGSEVAGSEVRSYGAGSEVAVRLPSHLFPPPHFTWSSYCLDNRTQVSTAASGGPGSPDRPRGFPRGSTLTPRKETSGCEFLRNPIGEFLRRPERNPRVTPVTPRKETRGNEISRRRIREISRRPERNPGVTPGVPPNPKKRDES